MTLRRFIAGCLAAAALAAAVPAQAGWTLLQSEHFSLYVERDESAGRRYLEQLEAFRWLALTLLGADEKSVRAQSRFDIYLMPGQQALKTLFPQLPENVAGVYYHCPEGSLAYGTSASRMVQGQDWTQIVLQHEYAHHLMFQYGSVAYPGWYVEGFAEYLATVRREGDRIMLGEVNEDRMRGLQGGWLPAEDLLRWGSWQGKGRHDLWGLYAQAWLLTHYMLNDPARAKQLSAYFDRLATGEDPVAAFEAATGVAPSALPRLLIPYQSKMRMFSVPLADAAKPKIRAVALPGDADEFLAEASALRTCVSPQRGQEILKKLRTLAAARPQSGPALRLALARAEVLFGEVQPAVDLLDSLVAADAQSAEAHYLLGRAWTRKAESLSGDAQAEARGRARAALIKAYRLQKDDAPTLYFLARALAHDGVDGNVVNAARAARLLAPGVADYAVFSAYAEVVAGERERAVRALGPLASDPHNLEQAARARLAIEAVRSGKSADEMLALLKPQPPKPSP